MDQRRFRHRREAAAEAHVSGFSSGMFDEIAKAVNHQVCLDHVKLLVASAIPSTAFDNVRRPSEGTKDSDSSGSNTVRDVEVALSACNVAPCWTIRSSHPS